MDKVQTESALQEAALVEEIARGSEEGLARLYDRYARLLHSLVLAILKDSRDAEEVLQEVFLQVWKSAARYEPHRGSVYAWLVTLARSRAIDRVRSKNFALRRDKESALDLDTRIDATHVSQLDAVLMLERAEVVRGALAKIPPEQRKVMQLAYYLGYTQSEIAREFGIPLGTVKSRMRQGMITFQSLLAQEIES